MGFFTRPELDDKQFKQEIGSVLNLSGTTNISGGTFSINWVPIDLSTGQTIGNILTFEGTKLTLQPNTGGASSYYTGGTPSNIEVGGMPTGTTLTGKTVSQLLEQILITTYYPTLTSPNNTFADDQSSQQEVGVTIASIEFTAGFSRGSISPQYSSASPYRSGLPNTYNYSGSGLPATNISTSLSDVQNINNYVVLAGANTWSNTVSYDAGVQPKDSAGGNYSAPLAAGTTGSKSTTITGIYPYFYGKTNVGRPTAGQTLIDSGTKVVATSNGTVNVTYNTTGAEWTWIAIPTASTLKTVWYVTALSNGTIGGAYPSGNKFPNPDTVVVNSPTALWSGISYRFYISEAAGIETNIEFRNS